MADLFRSITGESKSDFSGSEEPIRGELFSIERLEQYARALAAEHRTVKKKGRAHLLPRLEDNGRKLVAAYRELVETGRQGDSISPAAEWLLHNFHIVEEQLREIRADLPKRYYYELPKLADGELVDYPRIYALALALIAHTDSRLDPLTLKRFITAYQSVSPLSIGELWAVAISLRLALIENLRRLATQIVRWRSEQDEAARFADRVLELAATENSDLVTLVADRFARMNTVPRAFIVPLLQRLSEPDTAVTPVVDWIEKQLGRQGTTVEQVMHSEYQRQAAAQVTVGNIIASMRLLSTLDWRDFFEAVSLIDPVLGQDPAGTYVKMEFASRDRYRHVVERISKRTGLSELRIGEIAIELAVKASEGANHAGPQNHVGYYLIDAGVAQLEGAVSYLPRLRERLTRWWLRHPTFSYLGTLTLLSAGLMAFLTFAMYRAGTDPRLLAVTLLLAMIPVSEITLSILNWDISQLIEPRLLPSMNTAAGVGEDAQTMLVIPTILSSEAGVRDLLKKLEVHFLANQDEHFYFALLGDFADADREEGEADSAILHLALSGVDELNKRYATGPPHRFYLFHRRRLWNSSEGKWMGWERKRGKLREFNRLLRGAQDTSFIPQTANQAFLSRVRFVITLDSDTQLPRDVARRLVGTASHPLNRPQFDPANNRVTAGYVILQPRVGISLQSATRSEFSRIFSGNSLIDPYTSAVSDVYHDLFGEGNYAGKGLYDVDAFELALAKQTPENSLLSHDLFESFFARTALIPDIELLDEYPSRYDSYARRLHRWTRGDWQILRWLFPYVADASGIKVRNTLPLISRWKVLDKLRRSLIAPSLLIWLLAAWTVLPGSPWVGTLFAIFVISVPVYLRLTTSPLIPQHPRELAWTSDYWGLWKDIRANTARVTLSLAFLPQQAYLMLDAIVRTIYRKLISRRNLLQWVTAAEAEGEARNDRSSFFSFMLPAELFVLFAALLTLALRPESLSLGAPFLALWAASPFVAYWISRPAISPTRRMTGEDLRFARLVARRSWRFFETFVGPEDHWLPPDSFQEDPKPLIAHRTSPTNIGLMLLSTLTAHDFGLISLLELVERLELSFATLGRMERFRGHFFSGYDTITLKPLLPLYVSTAGSGNLAGHLIPLKQACIELPGARMLDERMLHGLNDAINATGVEAGKLEVVNEMFLLKQLRDEIEGCKLLAPSICSGNISSWLDLLGSLDRQASVIEGLVGALSNEPGAQSLKELQWWGGALRRQVHSYLHYVNQLAPWASISTAEIGAAVASLGEEVVEQWREVADLLDRVPKLAEIPEIADSTLLQLDVLHGQIVERSGVSQKADAASVAIISLTTAIKDAAGHAKDLLSRLNHLAQQCEGIFDEMDFTFLLDAERKVFTIGYNVSELRADNSYYDLLASAARLASFIAIAKGDVPQEHWFRLGRRLTAVNGRRALISSSGTMFEYLMPLLVTRNYEGTLLNQTYGTVVATQIEYGGERGVPWGITESAYNARDKDLNYQYEPFGVPGLGMKRGLMEDLVIAPHATILAAMINPHGAMENLRALEGEGALGNFGFYESIDYTTERLSSDQRLVLIRTFMTHHQGMSLVALDNALHDGRMEQRFHADPLVRATELLLQERVPIGVFAAHSRVEEVPAPIIIRSLKQMRPRVYNTPDLESPRTQLLSNGTYNVMLTTAGSGYSTCGSNAVTRWQEDVTRDNWGCFIYLRDASSGTVWSAGYQPVLRRPQSYEVLFSEDKVDITRSDAGIVTHTEIVVSAEDNAEMRRVSLTNTTLRILQLEVTSYAEIVLSSLETDTASEAFSDPFVETEFVASANALIAHRRSFSSNEQPVWAVHVISLQGEAIDPIQFETDRSHFIGRGHTTADPLAVREGYQLSNRAGAVPDPIFSLRQGIRILASQTARITFTTAIASSRDEAMMLAQKYHDANVFERESRLAWTKAQVEMNHLNLNAEEAHLFQRLAERVIYSDPSLRPQPSVLALNTRAQAHLRNYGMDGNLPIVLVRISSTAGLRVVKSLLRGRQYLRLKGLQFSLVVLMDLSPSYAQELLQERLQNLIRKSGPQTLQDETGGVFLRNAEYMPDEDRILLHAVARVVIVTERGLLEDQLARRPVAAPLPAAFVPRLHSQSYPESTLSLPELTFFNGLGGFLEGGREYLIVLREDQWTPAPWVNLIANQSQFGFQITETGAGYTWSGNCRENQLTPWSNDAVSDPPREIMYLRDEETGAVWSATPAPIREREPYLIRHGQGYTVFEHTSHGISQELLMFVPLKAGVKISLLRLRNLTERKRRLSVTHYNELVLGVQRSSSAPHIITQINIEQGSIFARNPSNNNFAGRVAFVATNGQVSSATCDRKEFLGRNGSLSIPAALRRVALAGRDGVGLDPCAAQQVRSELPPGEAIEIVFLLGEGNSKEEAEELVSSFRHPARVNEAFDELLNYWDGQLQAIEVTTPDTAMNTILNRWLLYQTLSGRPWSGSASYPSGAFAFRDQLQDVMALVYCSPAIAREQLLIAAHHQFQEGDVQHSWHPPTAYGIRTRSSDDLLWLPFVTSFYVTITGDLSVLDEVAPFLAAPQLRPDELECYTQGAVSSEAATLFEHCKRTLDRSLAVGQHGLPLIGGGDWTDGMNRVGHLGKGESVWVGWFLHKALANFSTLCDQRGEQALADRYRRHMESLSKALERHGWDGDWYRRAYFDDGTPLGSAQNDEYRIDSIAQSWGVISGAAEPRRALRAMAAVEEYLIRRGDGLVLLFTPPLNKSRLDPGWIKGYVPGVRDNGGQNTLAALWSLIAFATLGDGDRAGELFALLNPINHIARPAGLNKYKAEPYVAAGDLYAVPPHTGRGGLTWHTGAASWMYRAGLESILGFKLLGDRLQIDPCIPRWWRDYEITYRRGQSTYHIKVANPLAMNRGVATLEVDGTLAAINEILLIDDGQTHIVLVVMGEKVLAPGIVEPVDPLIILEQLVEHLHASSLPELAKTPGRISASGLEQLPKETRNAVETLVRVAQQVGQLINMDNLSLKTRSLEAAIGEIGKVQQRLKVMRTTGAPRIQVVTDEWLQLLLPIHRVIILETIVEDLHADSLPELTETPGRIGANDLEQLPEELKTAVQTLVRAAQHVGQFVIMRNLAIKTRSLNDAIAEIDKVQQSLKFMRSSAAPRIQAVTDEWLELVLPIRKGIQVDRVFSISNPFIFSKPIDPKRNSGTNLFSGRKDIIEQIETNILGANEPPTLLLHGPRRMGKTSILYQLPDLLAPNFASALIDMQSSDNTESLESLLRNIREAVSDSLERQHIKVARLNDDSEARPFTAFVEWLKRVEQDLPKDMRILLCFDEYEKLQEVMKLDWPKQFLDTLRSILQHHQRVVLMFTGVETLASLGTEWTDRFINAKYIRVSFLTFEEVRPLLQDPTPEFGITYAPGALEAIFVATGGQPFLTQAVAFELFDLLRERNTIVATLNEVEKAIEKAINSGDGYFVYIWGEAKEQGQAILRAIANGRTPPDNTDAMRSLQGADVINADRTFHVPMVGRWVREEMERELRAAPTNQ